MYPFIGIGLSLAFIEGLSQPNTHLGAYIHFLWIISNISFLDFSFGNLEYFIF